MCARAALKAQDRRRWRTTIWTGVVLRAARSVKGLPVRPEIVQEAREACAELRLTGKARKRARRPTPAELDQLRDYFARRDKRAQIPMQAVVEFALNSARRESEICRLEWRDNDARTRTGMVRDAKHPTKKEGNHRRFKYTPEAWVASQRLNRPVLALSVLIALGLGYFAADKLWFSKPPASARSVAPLAPAVTPVAPAVSEKSVAVLPFVDMSEKRDQEYFSDGLSEELIDMLTKIRELQVPARTSSFYFKGRQATVPDIAKTLSVAHVLEGSVRKSGNHLVSPPSSSAPTTAITSGRKPTTESSTTSLKCKMRLRLPSSPR
jgi:hypothetical protein